MHGDFVSHSQLFLLLLAYESLSDDSSRKLVKLVPARSGSARRLNYGSNPDGDWSLSRHTAQKHTSEKLCECGGDCVQGVRAYSLCVSSLSADSEVLVPSRRI